MDTRDAPRSLGSTVDPNFVIDFTEDIKELQEIDRSWSGVYAGRKPESPDKGEFWIDTDSMVTYIYDGVSWLQVLISEV